MQRKTIIGILAALAAAFTAVAVAQGPARLEAGERMLARLAYELDLSDAQEAAVREAVAAERERLAGVRNALRAERSALLEAMARGAAPGAIDARAQALSVQIAELVRAVGAIKRRIDPELDAEQRERLDAWLMNRADNLPRPGRRGTVGG